MKTAIAIYVLAIILFSAVAVSYDSDLLEAKVQKYSKAENAIMGSRQLSGYFQGKAGLPDDFDEKEAKHLEDVRKVLQLLQIALLILIVVLAGLLSMAETKKLLLYGGMITLALVILSSAIPFHLLFTAMHHALFPQGNWMFEADSTLIQYYPQELFMSYAYTIGMTISLIAASSVLVSFIIEKG